MFSLKLTIYGGAGEIGGNKILVESDATRVFLDYGVSYTIKSMYFSTFLQPRRFNLLGDYLITGVLPSIQGIYRPEMLGGELTHLNSDSPSVEACIISHAHLDHCGHASFLRQDIPLYMGEGTKVLISAREEAKQPSPEHIFNRGRYGGGRGCTTFRTGERFAVGDIMIEPVHVDHSIPAAYGLILESPDNVLAYTGDFRMHGPMSHMSWDFINRCREKGVETIVVEGTRIGDNLAHSEETVRNTLTNLIADAGSCMVAAVVGPLDFDRLKSLLQACLANDRALVISLHHAHILKSLSRAGLSMEIPKMEFDVLVTYQKRKGSGRYVDKDYRYWEAEILNDQSIPLLKDAEISANPDRYVLAMSRAEDIVGLASLKPPPSSLFILSTSEPHSEEQVLEMDKIENWARLLGMRFHHIHASGHASGSDIVKVIEAIEPQKIVPIHTQHPEMFELLIQERGMECSVIIPRYGVDVMV
ncbi:MAG: MBL fold metallo-hydrolase [Nitrososphaerota archaeon]